MFSVLCDMRVLVLLFYDVWVVGSSDLFVGASDPSQ